MSSDKNHLYQFDDYQLDAAERVLRRNGEIVHLPLKPFEVLLVLVKQHGRVVSKEELMKQVWPDSFVEEANLARHIYMLRQTLGESIKAKGGKHYYIQTIPGRGYRFAREVEACHIATGMEEQGLSNDYETTAECNDPSHLSAAQPGEEGEVTSNHVALAVSQAQPNWSWRLPEYHPLFVTLTIATLILLSVFLIILSYAFSG
jgi:DNA-binding winged helix-turn-helix (wHTH) protein